MFKRGTYRSFQTAPAVMAIVLLQQCHLTNPSEACAPSASCSCSTDFNNSIKLTCQVESLTNLTSSIKKPDEVHQLYANVFAITVAWLLVNVYLMEDDFRVFIKLTRIILEH